MPEAIAARLIGSLFVERGLVSESQIRVALEIQRETGAQLGQILVEKFGVSRKELTRVVADQWREMNGGDPGSGPDAAPGETWRPIGEIFVTRGFVSEDELDAALSRQRKTGERLGEALVALGVISKFELAGALGEQMATLQADEDGSEAPETNVVSLHQRQPGAEGVPFGALATPEPEAEAVAGPASPSEEDLGALLMARAAATRNEVEAVPPVMFEQVAEIEPVAEVVEPTVEALVPEPVFEPVEEIVEAEPPESVAEVAEPAAIVPELETVEVDPIPAAAEELYQTEVLPDVGMEVDQWEPEPVAVEPEQWEPEPVVVEAEPATASFVAYASTPKGYRLVALDVALPRDGETIDVPEFGELVVARIGRSPLPLDTRRCVYLEQSIASAAALASA
jgi:hypothetical protein